MKPTHVNPIRLRWWRNLRQPSRTTRADETSHYRHLGIYWFYIIYRWTKELNVLAGREKFNPRVVLLASIATCGITGFVASVCTPITWRRLPAAATSIDV